MLSKIFSRAGRKLAAVCLVTATTFFSGLVVNAASNVDGAIEASVVTQAGDGVSGATVTVTNADTGFSRTLTTNADGEVRFSSLAVGTYNVSVSSSAGNATRSGVIVNVGTGTSVTLVAGGDTTELGGLNVQATVISPIDISSTESATILGEATIDRIPVARNVTAIALLAPGTTRGDSAFGDSKGLASFGGSTVGENICYINGLNVTNFRNGLGCSTVPFEFYQEFQLKTGGYSAEFGRSTGGVINAVTKSGTNEYRYGFNMFLSPWLDGISMPKQNSYNVADGSLSIDRQLDETSELEANIYASGPIIQDKLHFFALYNLRDISTDNYARDAETLFENSSDDAFWGLKLDWQASTNHYFELTAFSDERVTESNQYELNLSATPATTFTGFTVGDHVGLGLSDRGGTNTILRYTGHFTPDFTLSAMFGTNEYSLSEGAPGSADCPLLTDNRTGAPNSQPGCWAASQTTASNDKRVAKRLDGEWYLGDHQLRFGLDDEENTASDSTQYSGGYWLNYETAAGSSDIAILRIFDGGGEFETLTSAIYIEDQWQVTDDVVLKLGLRNESFENSNSDGEAFIDISSQIAPRLGAAWDVHGDGTLKVFANYGRYFLPVATNTNIRIAGAELFLEEQYGLVDVASSGFPTALIDAAGNQFAFDPSSLNRDPNASSMTGHQATTRSVFGDGVAADTRSIVDQDIDPMYQDEFILGFMQDIGDGWTFGARAIFRDLKSTLEDIAVDAALNSLTDEIAAGGGAVPLQDCNGDGSLFLFACGFDYYVLTNPGSDVSIFVDLDGDGSVELVELAANDLGYPESERYYNAVEFLLERSWDGVWFLQGSYTWSQSYGNNEGFVRSDNGQDDAGLTTLFDQPGLLDGAYGRLPNDRTHSLKVFGAYSFAPNWQIGANILLESGRPINAFGRHPTDAFAGAYRVASFFQQGQLVPRGSRGRTPMVASLDLSLDYNTTIGNAEARFGVDLFNVLNGNSPTEVDENSELRTPFEPNPNYLHPTNYQNPRSIRFRVQFDF